MKETDDEEKVR